MEPRSTGVTRVELLCLALIGLVGFALVAPMLQDARETARRAHCSANLRRIGTALLAYNDAHGLLPPAAVWTTRGLDLSQIYKENDVFTNITDISPGSHADVTHENWLVMLLPHLGATHLHETDGDDGRALGHAACVRQGPRPRNPL